MKGILFSLLAAGFLALPASASASSLVTVGSASGTMPQRVQSETAVAIDANRPWVLAAGANDFIDWQPCPQDAATQRGTCRGSNRGVGLSGVYFSFDSGHTWTQPTYTGLTSRDCPSTSTSACTPHEGTIGTLPWYYENGLTSGGDPAVAFGPKPVNGVFSWSNGSRLYYANLTLSIAGGFPQTEPFRGFYAIGVSRLDNPTAQSVVDKNRWMAPVIATTRTSATTFEDKEQVWADNAATSPFFGNVYACIDEYRSNGQGNGFAQTVEVARSSDGGETWAQKQVNSAAQNIPRGFHGACSIRTDSKGVVYLFYSHFQFGFPGNGAHTLQKSYDGGKSWTRPRDLFLANDACYFLDPISGRCVADGYAGARIDLLSSPSVDIANGAPSGTDATDEIVDAWSDGRYGLNNEVTLISWSKNSGDDWSVPTIASEASDRSIYSAPAIAPNGSRVYLVYEGLQDPWRGGDMFLTRRYHGVFRQAAIGANGEIGAFATFENGPLGDIRASFPGHDIYQERVGDYDYAAATRTYGASVWTDVRNASVCGPVQSWRQASYNAGHRVLPGAPWPIAECSPNWGDVDIYAATTAP